MSSTRNSCQTNPLYKKLKEVYIQILINSINNSLQSRFVICLEAELQACLLFTYYTYLHV